MHTGERIKRLREAKGWSMTRLAEQSGVSKPYLSQIENTPNKKVSAELLFRIAQALDATMAQLLGRDVTRTADSDVPESLRTFADRANLSEDAVRMLANIRYRGKQPANERDWEYIYHTIKLAVEREE